ncbi:MAG: phospholipase A [Nitrospirae bacterium]|nr:phospholipase A [Nitrospirota bacterium]
MTAHRIWNLISTAGLAILIVASQAWADSNNNGPPKISYLDSYEPNTIGYTFDSDDVPFLDVKLSVKASLAPDYVRKVFERLDLYLGLTGRFGQYIGTRHSSPVVGKRYNPELFVRYKSPTDGYIELGYAHESNGQDITSPTEYDQARLNAERGAFAKDQISRGWDFIKVNLKSPSLKINETNGNLNGYLILKYFLPHGFLQGNIEEYNDWENDPEGKPRDRVNGIGVLLKIIQPFKWGILSDFKTAVIYETGYRDIFRYNTIRIEVGMKILEIPLIARTSSGYNSDLAQYYKKVYSWGVAYEIGGF